MQNTWTCTFAAPVQPISPDVGGARSLARSLTRRHLRPANETEPRRRLRHTRRSYQVEIICMWKRGLQANPLIIKLDRSFMARGSQEAVDLSPRPPPPLLGRDQISHIWYRAAMQFHVATRRGNWSVKLNCYGVGLRISMSEKLNPQA